jgi:hypothetical protein
MQGFQFIEQQKYFYAPLENFCIQNPPWAVWFKT